MTPPEPGPDIAADERDARAVVEGYVAAITAHDEPTAARFTCRKRDGSLLWVAAAGMPITVLSVQVGGTMLGTPAASAEIEVAGLPTSPLILRKIAGTWCIWP